MIPLPSSTRYKHKTVHPATVKQHPVASQFNYSLPEIKLRVRASMSEGGSDERQSVELPLCGADSFLNNPLSPSQHVRQPMHPAALQQATLRREVREAHVRRQAQIIPALNNSNVTTGTEHRARRVNETGTGTGLFSTASRDIGPSPPIAAAAPPAPWYLVTTLVNVLPKTVYDEAKEKQDTQRTLDYVRVQRAILEYLGIHATDTLSGSQACLWTHVMSLKPNPRCEEPLRLCYWMRSQGFDTYARIKGAYMSLYIANPDKESIVPDSSSIRPPDVDTLYWRQDIVTDEVVFAYVRRPTTVDGLFLRGVCELSPVVRDTMMDELLRIAARLRPLHDGCGTINGGQQRQQSDAGVVQSSIISEVNDILAEADAIINHTTRSEFAAPNQVEYRAMEAMIAQMDEWTDTDDSE